MSEGMEVGITFSLHQLRQELENTGHGFKLAHIREALEVMHLCNVRVECPGDSLIHRKSGAVLGNLETVTDPDDPEGVRSLYRVTFYLLASAAIVGELYYPINYARVMTITRGRAKWFGSTKVGMLFSVNNFTRGSYAIDRAFLAL